MIELRNVTRRFADVVAVDDITLNISGGEFFTLLGPSGCGKTTLLRLISGFERPDAGRILLGGKDVTDLPPFRRATNQVFQSYALFPHLNVEQNVEFGLQMSRTPRTERRTRVAEALNLVSLGGLERRKPSELSGGQKQRVALARALVNRPQTLLLDEPLAALDAKLREAMRLELKQLQQKMGITFVFVTHDQDEALTLSDRIGMMSAGRMLQVGSPRDLYDQPESLAVAKFIGQSNVLPSSAAATLRLSPPDARQTTLIIRPEDMTFCPPADAHFSATILQVLFRGEVTQYCLLSSTGEKLIVSERGKQAMSTAGQTVHCRINLAALRWFED